MSTVLVILIVSAAVFYMASRIRKAVTVGKPQRGGGCGHGGGCH